MFAVRIASALRPRAARSFSGAATLSKILGAEAKHEQDQYEQPALLKEFLGKAPFTFTQTGGDVNMNLRREIDDKVVTIDWQLTSPFGGEEMEGQENEEDDSAPPPTDFTISVETKSGSSGLTFYCSTSAGEGSRYVIGNVRQFSSAEEKDSNTAYNGPDFEDLDEKLQESFDVYLGEIGMNEEVCDFIDATALDKEQLEYMRWLTATQAFLGK